MNSENHNPVAIAAPNAAKFRLFWVLPVITALGLFTTFMIVKFADRIPGPFGGTTAAMLLIGLAIPAAVILVSGLRQAVGGFRELRAKLRWWHGMWLLAYLSALVFRVRDVPEARAEPLDAIALLRVGPEFIIMLLLLIRLTLKRPPWLRSLFRGALGFLAIYAIVCTLSTTWSVFPAWTLYHSLEYLMDLALLAMILAVTTSTGTYRAVLDWTWFVYGAGLALVWVEAVLMPQMAFQAGTHRLQGVFPLENWNDIGTTAAVLTVIAAARVWRMDRQKVNQAWYVLLMMFSFVTMLAAQTRNAIAGFLVGAVLILLFSKRVWATVLLIALASPMLSSDVVYKFLERDTPEAALSNFNGRMQFWQLAWDLIHKYPLTGLGAYAGGRFGVLAVLGRGDATTLHNDFLEVAIGTSFWGLIPFLMALLVTWVILVRSVHDRQLPPEERQLSLEGIGVLGVLTVHAFFNTDLSWHAPLIYLAVLGYAELLRRQRKARSVHAARAWAFRHDLPAATRLRSQPVSIR